jgi:tripartite-type tricarboxylate transporter receptor subunit TctC
MRQNCLAACHKIAVAFALAQALPAAAAQLVEAGSPADVAYPNRPIRLLVGLPPGGATDVMARIVAAKLGDALGQQIVVENRPGSGGLIAADTAAKAPPDGHTLLFGAISYSAVFASLYKKLPYDPVKDFAPISLVTKVPNVLVVNPATPVRTVSELIAYAKANPGKLSYGSSGNGTSLHLSMEMLKKQTGIEVVHVPYKGGPAAVVDLLAGRIHIMCDNLPGQIAHVKSGRTRALAVTTAKRNFQLPEVPTMMEAGVPGFEVTVWYGVFAPARVPQPILKKLNAELVKTLKMPEIRERMAEYGAEPAPTTREEFAAFQKAEVAKWAKVVKDSGLAGTN